MNATSNCKSACIKTVSTSNQFCRERPHYKCVQQVLKFGFTSEARLNLNNIAAMGEYDVTLCGKIVYFSFHGFNRKGIVANNSFFYLITLSTRMNFQFQSGTPVLPVASANF